MGFISRRKLIAGAAVATVALGSGVAYAYWTTTGSGQGSGNAAASNGTLVLNATVPNGIFPGGSVSVSFTADNSNSTDLFVSSIHLDSVAADSGHASCRVSDFSMPDVTENTTVPHNSTGTAMPHNGTLSYANDPNFDQGACKGATLTLTLSSS